MRSLTDDERQLLEQRRAHLPRYFQESMPVLVELCTALQIPEPWRVINEPSWVLPAVDTWLQTQARPGQVAPENRPWLGARVGYLLGYVLTERLGGAWVVDADPDSPTFGRYVIGELPRRAGVCIDPNQLAVDFIDGRAGDSLAELIAGTIAAL